MIRFWLNGQPVEVDGLSPTTTLLQYLRLHRGDTGTKEGCAEGDCGACTVALLDPQGAEGAAYRAVNACLLLMPMVNGRHVVTVEGLSDEAGPHPVQQAPGHTSRGDEQQTKGRFRARAASRGLGGRMPSPAGRPQADWEGGVWRGGCPPS